MFFPFSLFTASHQVEKKMLLAPLALSVQHFTHDAVRLADGTDILDMLEEICNTKYKSTKEEEEQREV